EPAGPRELRELAGSFNAMAADLEAARRDVEAERRRLATVIESLGDGLIVCDPDGRVLERNPRAATLVPELDPGHRLADDPGPLPPLRQALGREVEVEHGGRTLSVTAARLGPRTEDGVVFTVRDVSERARLERLKTEFVATASHELRSPLTSIKGFVELLEASPSLSDKQREFVEIILLSTNRLVDLVNDLLDVARIEAGRLAIARRPVAIREVVEEVAALMRPRVEEAGQTLELDFSPEVVAADADPERLRQIVTNLVTNAHLYTPEGGRIRVGVGPEADRRVALTVADTGRGMDAEQLSHLFDRFYRAAPASSGPSGSGLGLSIVRSLVDLHGGTIDVDSTPGEGTTFTVHLPAAQPTTEETSPRALLRGRRVMVVEDDPGIAKLIATQLEPWEVETVLVDSGEEAIARLRAESFDAVTLDILLGGMTGFEVLRAVREDPELRDTAVVVVSVFSGREALAGEWVVSKPIDADELTGALGSAMLAGRTRVLVVGRDEVRPTIAGALERLGIDHEWASSGEAAARLCEARRFEVALVDAGLPSPHDVITRLDLRGRRERRSIIVFSDGDEAPGLARLDAEPVAVETAGAAVLAALGDGATSR
ncbi:MAG TPA: ATP-binding protein, partial [Solirubrobacteraceae bacterium]